MARRVKKQQDIHMVMLGAGYTARALIRRQQAQGIRITATRRSAKAHSPSGIEMITYNGGVTNELRAALLNCTHLLSSIPPGPLGDPVLYGFPDLKDAAPNLKWAGYLSATSVYGDRAGQWAFEDETPNPKTVRGRRRVETELKWLETGLPVHIFRLAGIYGPGRSPFEKLKSGTARAVIKSGHVVNRIHVDDIAEALLASMNSPNPQRIYNIADGHPCPPQDVLDYAAALIGVPKPARTTTDDQSVSDMARSFYSETKRIDITRAKDELGWTPKYPDYKAGLKMILGKE